MMDVLIYYRQKLGCFGSDTDSKAVISGTDYMKNSWLLLYLRQKKDIHIYHIHKISV